MPSSLATMVADLKFWGQIQASEGFVDPTDYNTIVGKASTQHNPAYSCTGSSFTIPETEVPVVSILALALLCQIRASKMAQAPTMRTGDFQTTRDTPFEKNMALHEKYMQQYKTQCQVLGLSSYYGSSSVKVSEFTGENTDLGAMTPVEIALEPPVVNLTTPSVPIDGVLTLSFSTTIFGQFATRYVYHLTGSEPLFQDWNFASTVLPKVNDSAELLISTQNQRATSFKVTNLVMTVGTVHRFLVVTQNRSGIYGYSNEVTVTIPTP